MSILVWGFGEYYKKKSGSIPEEEISAFISSRETGQIKGKDIISPKDIKEFRYEKLYIMTGPKAGFEILDELRNLGYTEWNKVLFGWSLKPYSEEEALLFGDGEIKCDSEEDCIYFSEGYSTHLRNIDDWDRLKQEKVRIRKPNKVSGISIDPISSVFGIDRGLPVDRYYIEHFLKEHADCIKGRVLEVAGREYTMKYGTDIRESFTMHVCDATGDNSIIANLETGEGVIENFADCFILTQTLPFIFDVRAAAENTVKFLKSGGGTALITVAGITQISRYDMDRWGHYWSFTMASLKKIFEMCEDVESIDVDSYGNVKSSSYGLYGLAAEELGEEELLYHDDDYQQIITAVVKKR